MKYRHNERGQAIVLTVLALVVLLGMAALVLDVGSWYRTKRQLQATADAAALAGAQQLPNSPGGAQSMAQSYADQNGGNVLGANITISTTDPNVPNDTIAVKAAKNESGLFSSVLGIGNADIAASAKARVGPPVQARYVAPMVVYCGHELIQNCSDDHTPTFGEPTTLPFDKEGAPGAFGMLNLDGGSGTPGSDQEADWILHGFDKYLPLGKYRSDPGGKFESQNIQSALDLRQDTVLLFPVFKKLEGTGQNAEYVIIGWIGFHLTGFEIHGHNATLHGYFTEYIAQGILSQSGGPGSSGGGPSSTWGVKSIQLIE